MLVICTRYIYLDQAYSLRSNLTYTPRIIVLSNHNYTNMRVLR